jgi:hypothetical protein
MKREIITTGLGSACAAALMLCTAQAQTTPPPPGQTPPPSQTPGQTPPRAPGQTPPASPPRATGDASCEHGYVAAPPGSEALTTPLAPQSIQLFMDDEFKGTELMISGFDASMTPGALNEMSKGLNDSMSAVRWNLSPGVIVVFYEDASGKGEQLVLWGKGQHSDLDKWDYNDKASRWAWYDVGGGMTDRSAGANLPPNGSEPPATAVPVNTIQVFIDKDFRDDMKQISPVSGQPHGQPHDLPSGVGDKLTSLRWNLPDGVIVMLHQTGDAEKQQVALWGSGQVKDLDVWDFNDKASRWSWSYVGSPAATKPTTPPSTPPAMPSNPPPRTPPPSNPPPPPPPGNPSAPPPPSPTRP